MQNLYRAGRRDANEKDIKEYLDSISVPYVVLMPGQGADLLLLMGGECVFVEIKNPESPKHRQELTETEKNFKLQCEGQGISYWVIFEPMDISRNMLSEMVHALM